MASNFIFYTILGEVNGRTPADGQISMWFVSTKLFDVLERHRELFPESQRRSQLRLCAAAGFSLFIATTLVALVHYSTYVS